MELKVAEGKSECLVFSVDRKWNSSGFSIAASKMFAEQAKNIVLGLPPYIVAKYGEEAARIWIATDSLDKCRYMSWNSAKNQVITNLERELDNGLLESENMFWYENLPPRMVEQTTPVLPVRPSNAGLQGQYLPDASSVSTFGAPKSVGGIGLPGAGPRPSPITPSIPPAQGSETSSVTTRLFTYESRLSVQEMTLPRLDSRFDELMSLLKAQQSAGDGKPHARQ